MGAEYRRGWWPLQADPAQSTREAAIHAVPPGTSVSATYSFVPHLTHRVLVYEFPVPWRDINWGVHGEHLDDPNRVDWIVVQRDQLNADGEKVLDGLLGHAFRVVFDRDGIVVARRQRAAPA